MLVISFIFVLVFVYEDQARERLACTIGLDGYSLLSYKKIKTHHWR